MEYSPPPLFKQGASARAKMVCFALAALVLLFIDSHMRTLGVVRQAVSTVLYPLQVVALAPRDALYYVGGYFTSLADAQSENDMLKRQQTLDAQALQQRQQLLSENAQLRNLLQATERLPVKSVMGEILYDTRDRFTRKIILNRGSQDGVQRGQPVIDHIGVVGQVTRVFPFSSEVTLVTDKDQAVPVQVVRNGLRSVTYGQGPSNLLELRFQPTNVDIQEGDTLITSGIDGIYPPGLSVAVVREVERKSDMFAHIVVQPTAGFDRNRQLLILLVENQYEPRPPDDNQQSGRKKGLLQHASSRGEEAEEKAAVLPDESSQKEAASPKVFR